MKKYLFAMIIGLVIVWNIWLTWQVKTQPNWRYHYGEARDDIARMDSLLNFYETQYKIEQSLRKAVEAYDSTFREPDSTGE